ncbi:flagellar biosynthesis repressor FlbT [Roseicyclus sp. F158]|uniref:Flagellar biosynthesis repressor FlbT n=1 Tax=Tropicimonas omnivorans TaxID=3075590 RepID=A0ABU3DDA5_9RHOB|nr:flagellar biosynthesis repressor FlbT [Roseicyclus sp. F158]MDT0681696.1 flagellar biosynthesis repressor FlbT [Roseicyclus sp. F158]
MSGLVLKLGPGERVLINGAVIENGERRSRLSIVSKNANILRLRDAIHPEEATTPVRRVCYIAQLVLAGDAAPDEAQHQILRGIDQLSQVFVAREWLQVLSIAGDLVHEKNFYQALKILRRLIPEEDRLMSSGLA